MENEIICIREVDTEINGVSRRSLLKILPLSVLAPSFLLTSLAPREANAFWPIIIRFLGQALGKTLIRSSARSISRKATRGAVNTVSRSARGKAARVSATGATFVHPNLYDSRKKKPSFQEEFIQSSIEVAGEKGLGHLLNDTVWYKQNVKNEASAVITNYGNSSTETGTIDMVLEDKSSREPDLRIQVDSFALPAQSECVLDFSVEELPNEGLKNLTSYSNRQQCKPSGNILVADTRYDGHGMTISELYQQYLQRR